MRDYIEKERTETDLGLGFFCEPDREEGTRGLWIGLAVSSFLACSAGFRERPQISAHFGPHQLDFFFLRTESRAVFTQDSNFISIANCQFVGGFRAEDRVALPPPSWCKQRWEIPKQDHCTTP